jgi:hypothetical protein
VKTFLLLLCLVTSASGYLIEDPIGDTVIAGPNGPIAFNAPQIDIVKSWINEQPESLTFGVLFEAANDTRERLIEIEFTIAGNEFLIGPNQDCPETSLQHGPSRTNYGCLHITEATNNESAEIKLPKTAFTQKLGRAIGPGDALESILFRGYATTTLVLLESDEAANGKPVLPSISLPGESNLFLYADEPYFYSNGEAGTFVYNVTLRNNGPAAIIVLNASNVPNGWDIVLPNALSVGEGEHRDFYVITTIGSRHLHGETETFTITASSNEESFQSELGIFFPTIPNPAGHHSTLYFHGDPPAAGVLSTPLVLWMNTVTDSEYTDAPYPAVSGGFDGTFEHYWLAQLQPRLQMGLDFIEGGTAWLNGSMNFDAPSISLEISANLILGGSNEQILASSGPITLPGATTVDFEIPLTVLDEINQIPFVEGSNMELEIMVNHIGAPYSERVTLNLQGTTLQLPLTDFRPEIPNLPTSIKVEGFPAGIVPLNIGKGTLLELLTTGENSELEIQVEGLNSEWVTHEEGARPGEKFHLFIDVPETASIGDRVDVVVVLRGDSGEWLQPLIAEVSEASVEDQHWSLETKESPFPLLIMIIALVGIGFRRPF